MRENPDKPIEQAQLPGKSTKASRVIINGSIVDLLDQNGKISVWIDGFGSRKETTVQDAFEFIQVQLS
jgi:hypothetical protein